jgi:tRNA (guanosine-2'-O-)-methyltransferase
MNNWEDPEYAKQLCDFYRSFKLEQRNELMDRVLRERTKYMTVVLENIYQPHNASAVLRSCDCFGVQDVHIIENEYKYEFNPHVSLGAAQWLSLHQYNSAANNTPECIASLKNRGYRIVATSPGPGAVPIQEFDISRGPFALMFGTEKFGLTPEACEMADESVRIPMYGFTESFNISVSVALCLFHFTERLRSESVPWQLTEPENTEIMLQWCRNTHSNPEKLEASFRSAYQKPSGLSF